MAAGDVAVMPRRLIDRFATNDRRAHAWEEILGDAGHALPAGEQKVRLAGLDEHASRNLRTLGWVDPPTFWSACDLAVLTSDNEAMP